MSKSNITEWNKGFVQGFVCAVCTGIRNHGMGTEMCDMWRCSRMSIYMLRKHGVEEYDIDLLKKHWKELNHDIIQKRNSKA